MQQQIFYIEPSLQRKCSNVKCPECGCGSIGTVSNILYKYVKCPRCGRLEKFVRSITLEILKMGTPPNNRRRVSHQRMPSQLKEVVFLA